MIPQSIKHDAIRRYGHSARVYQDGRFFYCELTDGQIVKLGKAKQTNRPKETRRNAFA